MVSLRRFLLIAPLIAMTAVVCTHAQSFNLIAISNVWRYDQSGNDLSGQFNQSAYNDSTWPQGPGLLGLETNVPPPYAYPILTPLAVGGGRITYYFRTHFNFPTNPVGMFLVITNYVDDGMVLYVNGQESGRIRIPHGPVTAATLASQPLSEGQPVVLIVPATNVVQGDNLLAVEVHQNTNNSSDVVFGLSLLATSNPPALLLPDLIIWGPSVNPRFETHIFGPASTDCEVRDGCGITGTRRLLRFDTETRNIGPADLLLGNPVGNPLFVYDSCHGHYHFYGFADYRLIDSNGVQVVAGNKVGFCLEDLARWDSNASSNATYYCYYQGIQKGWGDVYNSALPCQYVDITDVPVGTYTLELEIDPDNRIQESNETNNIVRTTVVIKPPCASPPPNDSFAGAQVVPYRTATAFANSECATKEPGEPANPFSSGGKSVWFRWTAPYTGIVTINTIGSNFDTILSLYRGSSLGGLTRIASDDDSGVNYTSQLSTNVTMGTVYQIVVDGYDGAGGDAVLSINPGGNDLFTNCVGLSGVAGTIGGTTTGTGKEALEPNHACAAGGGSIWYCWTATNTGTMIFDTIGSRVPTLLGVYTGSSVSALTLVDASASALVNGASRVSFVAVTGTTYCIAIDSRLRINGVVNGVVLLNWHPDPQPPEFSLRAVPCVYGSDFAFYINATPGQRCVIETSPDLTNWFFFALATNVPGSLRLTDSVNGSRGFYRARTE